jgi:hypothetical protein
MNPNLFTIQNKNKSIYKIWIVVSYPFHIDLLMVHYEKLCQWRPHDLATRAQKPFKYNCVITRSSKV